jgi:hypothetical protein
LILPRLFSDEHWKVKHQIVFYLTILLVIATLNGIYTNYINALSFSWSNYWWIISRTFVLGGIPVAFLTRIDYQRKAKSNTKQASDILTAKKAFTAHSSEIIHQISTDLKEETIRFEEDAFMYAMAVGNYIDMWILVENIPQKITYRLTLSSFEAQLRSLSLKRCHRSYLVNLKKIENISGNAQGLKLELKNHSEVVPVSRKYIPLVRQFFQKHQS